MKELVYWCLGIIIPFLLSFLYILIFGCKSKYKKIINEFSDNSMPEDKFDMWSPQKDGAEYDDPVLSKEFNDWCDNNQNTV